MSIKDVIKSSVYESFGSGTGLSIYSIILILATSCIIGAYVFFVYKTFTRSEFYSKDLNVAIALMAIIVAAIMIAMQSNLLVSLGMVGALSIVRFRTAVKNPMDLLYLFWSISAGIIVGVHLYALAIALCIIMTLAIWLLNKVPANKAPGLIVVRCSAETDMNALDKLVKEKAKYVAPKSTRIFGADKEAIYELTSTDINSLIADVNLVEGVKSVNWVEHNGEMRN